jgi:hypothetical protein
LLYVKQNSLTHNKNQLHSHADSELVLRQEKRLLQKIQARQALQKMSKE